MAWAVRLCLSSVTLLRPTQRVKIFANIFSPSNSLETWTVCVRYAWIRIKYGEKRFSIWRMELLHPAMWHVESWQWIHQVAAPCNVIRGSGMNFRHIRILSLVSILTTSPQSTCHSTPVCEILSKSDHPQPKKNDVMSIFKMADLSHLGF